MEQPFMTQYEVVAVATANAKVTHIDARVGGIGVPLFQLIIRLDTATLVTKARKPRTG